MTSNENYFNPDRIIAIFFLFVLATSTLFIHFFAQLTNTGWQIMLNKILLYFGIFGYAAIIGIVLFYYIARANSWLKKDYIRVVIVLGVTLGLGYSLFDSLSEKSWLIFFRDIFMTGLIIIGLPFIDKLLLKIPKLDKKQIVSKIKIKKRR